MNRTWVSQGKVSLGQMCTARECDVTHGLQQFFMELFWIFLSALISIILYTSVFLWGYPIVQGWKVRFWGTSQNANGNASELAMQKIHVLQMILYPFIMSRLT
ncbi:hypothetical protein M422DRAFT_49115 [Sphaerobolus stellatus SS14]|uniref:Uncharacterized protein n=1 Tax=Sphaerobolus stellatus (strain SS14) TaxID=990650 RepID=A0A0C9V0F2_SPHS4|nr:hypothetical protein M422DRAFT_49115 [Sphaerobolus stellatus SS14]